MHDSSVRLLCAFRDKYLLDKPTLTFGDVGCYDESECYKQAILRPGWNYVGIDARPGKNVDLVTDDDYKWSIVPANYFDVVISGQTLEHIPAPWKWIWSVMRITRPGGLIWICAPNTWEFHAVPKDCWRVWPDGIRALFEEAGIEVLEAEAIGPDTYAVGRKACA